jgi:hypothetical protein
VLERVTDVVAVGTTAPEILARVAEIRSVEMPAATAPKKQGEALLWSERDGRVRLVQTMRPSEEHRRHTRKYAEGNLPPERSFYFRGKDKRLNLRAKNLIQFLELANGVDDETWQHHFRLGDYSRWFRDAIKDDELADETQQLERSHDAAKAASLPLLREAIERRYTLPASPPMPVPGAE